MAGDPTAALASAIAKRRDGDGVVALMNAPGHMEDHQVVAFLAKALRAQNVSAEVVSSSQLRWENGTARLPNARVAAIFRFYQAEWLAKLPEAIAWRPLFAGGRTPVANPGLAALSESKRLPLVWDRLGVAVPTWRRLLPETRALADAPWARDERWLLKAAYGNTGDTVTIRAAMPAAAWWRRACSARLSPSTWLAQRRFEVLPLDDGEGRVYPCVGVYTVDGAATGAYARVSRGLVIDAYARDAALLVSS
jgi:glutathionylspermidine synthase